MKALPIREFDGNRNRFQPRANRGTAIGVRNPTLTSYPVCTLGGIEAAARGTEIHKF